jgi:hypothetical protein
MRAYERSSLSNIAPRRSISAATIPLRSTKPCRHERVRRRLPGKYSFSKGDRSTPASTSAFRSSSPCVSPSRMRPSTPLKSSLPLIWALHAERCPSSLRSRASRLPEIRAPSRRMLGPSVSPGFVAPNTLE